MRIAVISDTHDRLPSNLPPLLAEADEIWHLGDVCAPTTLTALYALGLPLHIVQGNCDDDLFWPLTLDLERNGHHCHLVHIPPRSAPVQATLLLHGHTHVPRWEKVHGTIFANPGCITRPNRGAPASWAWLTLEKGQSPKWELVLV